MTVIIPSPTSRALRLLRRLRDGITEVLRAPMTLDNAKPNGSEPPANLIAGLVRHAGITPGKPAVILWQNGSCRVLSFGDLLGRCTSLADRLGRVVHRKGVVFIILRHHPMLHASFLACMMKGLIPSYLPYPTPKQNRDIYFHSHQALMDRVRPAAIITSGDLIDTFAAMVSGDTVMINIDDFVHEAHFDVRSARYDGDAVALLQHSSGTTGLKKGVALTFDQIARQTERYTRAVRMDAGSTIVSWLPLYHDMGLLTSFLMPVAVGATVVAVDPFEWVSEPQLLLRLIELFHGTHTWLPNFAFKHILNATEPDAAFDLSSMVTFVSCSEMAKPATMRAFGERFASCGAGPDKLQACYAMAESVFAVTQYPVGVANRIFAFDRRAIEAGRPLEAGGGGDVMEMTSNGPAIEGVEVGIMREDGTIEIASRAKEVGEIVIRGDFVFERYFENPLASAEAFVDGWYRTGDLGFMMGSELFICGRKKDLVIVHGRNFYCHDIEEIVSELQAVIPGRVVAIGETDETTGSEEVIILAETRIGPGDQVAENELRREVKRAVFDRLELVPKKVAFMPPGWLAKTTSGKISRVDNLRRLRDSETLPS